MTASKKQDQRITDALAWLDEAAMCLARGNAESTMIRIKAAMTELRRAAPTPTPAAEKPQCTGPFSDGKGCPACPPPAPASPAGKCEWLGIDLETCDKPATKKGCDGLSCEAHSCRCAKPLCTGTAGARESTTARPGARPDGVSAPGPSRQVCADSTAGENPAAVVVPRAWWLRVSALGAPVYAASTQAEAEEYRYAASTDDVVRVVPADEAAQWFDDGLRLVRDNSRLTAERDEWKRKQELDWQQCEDARDLALRLGWQLDAAKAEAAKLAAERDEARENYRSAYGEMESAQARLEAAEEALRRAVSLLWRYFKDCACGHTDELCSFCEPTHALLDRITDGTVES